MKEYVRKIIAVLCISVLILSLSSVLSSAQEEYDLYNGFLTWYPQGNTNDNPFPWWDRTNLDYLTFRPFSSTRTLVTLGDNSGIMNSEGCYIASYAMVLKNMGAYTKWVQSDYPRSIFVSALPADPFTVTMANTATDKNGQYWRTVVRHAWNDYQVDYDVQYTNPVFISDHNRVVYAFGKTQTEANVEHLNDEQKAAWLTQKIQENPNGIIVRVNVAGKGSHALVFTGSTYSGMTGKHLENFAQSLGVREVLGGQEELVWEREISTSWVNDDVGELLEDATLSASGTPYDHHFTCYEPASSRAAYGRGVNFSDTWTRSYYGGINTIKWVRIIK